MNQPKQQQQNTLTAPRALTAVLVLQGLILAGQWAGQPRAAEARAATERNEYQDPAAQRQQVVAQLERVNEKLGRIATLLEEGNAKEQERRDQR